MRLQDWNRDPMRDAPRWARELYRQQGIILQLLGADMINLDTLTANIARLQASDTTALALLQQVRDQNKSMADQLSQLQAGDPDTQAKIDALAKQANDAADTVDAAVANNPNTPNLPPATDTSGTQTQPTGDQPAQS